MERHPVTPEHDPITSAYWALRVALGVIPIAAGADKFLGLLANWQAYLSPLAVRLLPISPAAFLDVVGVVEIVVGIGILAGRARLFGLVATAWLAAIAVNLLLSGHYLDVAARDVGLAVAAWSLSRLALRCEVGATETAAPAASPRQAHA